MSLGGYSTDSADLIAEQGRQQELARRELAYKINETRGLVEGQDDEQLFMKLMAIWVPDLTVKQLVEDYLN